jgi:2-hydroxy-5-methyl-1-naphthoate 7-hydroxylase
VPTPSPSVSRCPVLDPAARAVQAEAAGLRAQAPAVLVELPGGVRAWSVTRHAVIRALTTDPRVSRDCRRHWPGVSELPEGWPMATVGLQQNFFNAYGEEHRRLRGRVTPAFSPRRVERLRPMVQEIADGLVEKLAATAPGQAVDLRHALSLPLTMSVICELLGVPEPMRESLGKAIDAILETVADREEVEAREAELYRCLTALLDHKRRHPGADLTTDLLAPSGGEPPLPEQEQLDSLLLMLGAGYETSVNLITSAVHALLAHPGHLDLVRRGAVTWRDVVEETLRHEGPVMHLPLRCALEDIDLGEGVVVRKGEALIIGFAAAGRDPGVHPDDPDVFDPARAGKEHLAFGHGPHFCLGAHLARLETEVALSTLFARLPGLAPADPDRPPPRIPSLIINGFTGLPVVPVPGGGDAGGG